ncbi:hypothetical protein [Microbulbifer discodermiae]|uniref:hypothetical protein n=1 Tax=Microbulbifer sp. 2201CG32-9 TaxID=3232309 RepID=UPI00345BE89A
MSRGDVSALFFKGLNKVASVIDGNPNYDYILGDRLGKEEYLKAENVHGEIECDVAYEIIKKKLNAVQVAVYALDLTAEIIAFGSTANNRREFAYVSALLERNGFKHNVSNICDCNKLERVLVDSQSRAEALSALYSYLSIRKKISKSLLHQTINYSIAFFSAKESLRKTHSRLFVVANDHSPMPVGFCMVARLYGLTTLYVQHAEVTEAFPENDFDFSVLRNLASREIYEKIGRTCLKQNICLPRTDLEIYREDLLAQRGELRNSSVCSVVIYPSSIFNLPSLKELVNRLGKNNAVEEIYVKPHPACCNQTFISELNVGVIDSIPSWPHIAICGNSSVVIELLAKGNLVYQFFGLDNIAADYYGFVRKELSAELLLDNIANLFWSGCKHDDKFLVSLGRYVSEIETEDNLLERSREKLFFQNLMNFSKCKGRRNKEALREYQLFRGLFYFPYTFLSDGSKYFYLNFNDHWVVSTLDKYFNTRISSLNHLYTLIDLDSCRSTLHFWIICKKIEWTGFCPTHELFSALETFVASYGKSLEALKWMEKKLFDLLLRYQDIDSLRRLLFKARVFSVSTTGVNRKVAFVRFYNQSSTLKDEFSRYYNPNIGHISPLERLKVSVQAMSKTEGRLEYTNFEAVESEFLGALPKIENEYRELVQKTYSQLEDRVRYMDVARNQKQAEEFIELIKTRLKSKVGYAFLRLSDGEGYLFRSFSSLFLVEDAKNRERHWWGKNIPQQLSDEVVSNGIRAFESADIIGIPCVYRFLRDSSESTASLLNSITGRGLLAVLAGIRALDDGSKLYTDDKANLALFRDLNILRDLVVCANKVIIVSSGDKKLIRARLALQRKTCFITVPTHYKTSTNNRYESGLSPLPYEFDRLREELEVITEPGDLVLVGAGVAGKGFVDAAKRKSAVGLDLGSIMDEFLDAGIHSLH